MDDACAEGIADEHYRLEGRLGLLYSLYSSFCELKSTLLPPSHLRSCSSFLSMRGYKNMKSPVTRLDIEL